MIFDVIYDFYTSIFDSVNGHSGFWQDWLIEIWSPSQELYVTFGSQDFLSCICTVVTIICGIFALFRIFGGVLRLFKV